MGGGGGAMVPSVKATLSLAVNLCSAVKAFPTPSIQISFCSIRREGTLCSLHALVIAENSPMVPSVAGYGISTPSHVASAWSAAQGSGRSRV